MRKPDVTTVVASENKQKQQITLHASKKDFLLRRNFPGNATVKTFRFELIDDIGQIRHVEKISP